MGIRFFCPNGHKLNVKDFQAGQIGVCPECGEKSPIPLTSTRPSSRQKEQESELSIAKPEPRAAPSMAKPAPLPPPPPKKIPDPKEDAENLIWYVRPAAGGQYGPANTGVIHQWLAEGRIDPNALVWREGWHDWLQADCVFPELASRPAMPDLDAIIVVERGDAPAPVVPPNHQRKPIPTPLLFVGILAASVIILIFVLLIVLLNQ